MIRNAVRLFRTLLHPLAIILASGLCLSACSSLLTAAAENIFEDPGAAVVADAAESGPPAQTESSDQTGSPAQTESSDQTGSPAQAESSDQTGSPAQAESSDQTGSPALTESSDQADPPAQTEPSDQAEIAYDIPPQVTAGLRKNTPDGEAARMKGSERSAFISDIYQANSAGELWKRHEDVSAVFSLYDEDSLSWEDFCTFYADPTVYYSDDWTPGLEELRLLIYGEDNCVEDYTNSQRFVCFLNASGVPYRRAQTDPVTLDEDTRDEALLRIIRTDEELFVVTQLTEPSILRFGLEETAEDAFYSCLYLLDADTLEVMSIRISLHEPNEEAADEYIVEDVRNIDYTYDHGMSGFVETGYNGLYRHLVPESVWEPEDLRSVSVTLDPGTDIEKTVALTTLKGDPVSFSLPDGYELFCDKSLTVRWFDNGDYTSDLSLWAGQAQPETDTD